MATSLAPGIDTALVWPQSIVTPSDPRSAGGVAAGLHAAFQGASSGRNQADWNSGGIVQKGYVLNSFSEQFASTIIHEGQLVFLVRGEDNIDDKPPGSLGGADAMPMTVLSLPMVNMMLRDDYDDAMRVLAEASERQRGLRDRTGMLEYLTLDEDAWTELYRENGKMIRSSKTKKIFYHLTKQGIMSRINFLGMSMFASAPDRQSVVGPAHFPLNIAFKGVRSRGAKNIWGENAGPAAKLFLVLKRRFNPQTGEWGAFAFHPVADESPVLPESVVEYLGIHGGKERGIVISIGMNRDSLPSSLSEDAMLYAQGLHPNSTAPAEYNASKTLSHLDIAIHKGIARVIPL